MPAAVSPAYTNRAFSANKYSSRARGCCDILMPIAMRTVQLHIGKQAAAVEIDRLNVSLLVTSAKLYAVKVRIDSARCVQAHFVKHPGLQAKVHTAACKATVRRVVCPIEARSGRGFSSCTP